MSEISRAREFYKKLELTSEEQIALAELQELANLSKGLVVIDPNKYSTRVVKKFLKSNPEFSAQSNQSPSRTESFVLIRNQQQKSR